MDAMRNTNLCTGCAACSNICPQKCITMIEDNEGFEYPVVNTRLCINCNKCVAVCPVMSGVSRDKLAIPKVYACKNKNETVRLKSSSGGVFSVVAEHVLGQNGIVFGAMFDNKFDVVHGFIDRKHDLDKLRRSKYVQSRIGVSYQEAERYLVSRKLVLFSGTPCQIAGLRTYLGKEYENLITCEVICHGVPSRRVYREYLRFLEDKHNSKISDINFRAQDRGWDNFGTRIRFGNGVVYENINSVEPLYMRGFLTGLYLRPSCYSCNFKHNNSIADFTLGDYWRIAHRYPYVHDGKGISLVVANTKIGEDVFRQIAVDMDYLETSFDHASECNQLLDSSPGMPYNRESFFRDLGSLEHDELMGKYCRITRLNYWLTRLGFKPLIRRLLNR